MTARDRSSDGSSDGPSGGSSVESGHGLPLARDKLRDRAMVLPVIGLVLLVPPIAAIFELDARIAGIPFAALYLFGVWLALIVAAARLARPLRDAQAQASPGSGEPPAGPD